MATRVKESELQSIVDLINKLTENRFDFTLGYAYGGVRLESKGGSRDISPRLGRGEMHTWLHAFADGMSHAVKVGYYAETSMYHAKGA